MTSSIFYLYTRRKKMLHEFRYEYVFCDLKRQTGIL